MADAGSSQTNSFIRFNQFGVVVAGSSSKTEDLWSNYRDLKVCVWRCLSGGKEVGHAVELENVLRKHKQNFHSLLQNPPKNTKHREELQKSIKDGISVRGLGEQTFSKELYQETVVLSDLFDMNEYVALDLLCTAQIHMAQYPGLPRGLVAVLLYFEGRKCLLTCLRYLVQARPGVQWALNTSASLEQVIKTFTDQLLESGLFDRIFELLRSLNLKVTMEKLQQNLALGDAKHRRQVIDLFESIRYILADIVFLWASQTGLPKTQLFALVDVLKQTEVSTEAKESLGEVTMLLLMALIACVDISPLHSREDGDVLIQDLPIFKDATLLDSLTKELTVSSTTWKCTGMLGAAQFALAVCLASVHQVHGYPHLDNLSPRSEEVLNQAMEQGKVFEYFESCILENEIIDQEEYVYRLLHHLFANFVVHMWITVKELRMRAEDSSRTVLMYLSEGITPPNYLHGHYEWLLMAMNKLYDHTRWRNELIMDFWKSPEVQTTQLNTSILSTRFEQMPSTRWSTLYSFINMCGEKIPTTVFVPHVRLLSNVSACPKAARNCFNMLKAANSNQSNTLSWDHFFQSFAQYYNSLKRDTSPLAHDTIYYPQRNALQRSYARSVSPLELKGLHAVLHLIRSVAQNDEFARLALCEHPLWAPLSVLLGLVECHIPIPLKADLLRTLAVLCKSPELSTQMWHNVEASQILATIPNLVGGEFAPRGISTELEEIESRLEEYPLTRAFVELLDALTDHEIPRTLGAGKRQPGFEPYLRHVIDAVFLKCWSRTYKEAMEKWQVAHGCLKLMLKLLHQYEPSQMIGEVTADFQPHPGFNILHQLQSKPALLQAILTIIDDGQRILDKYVRLPCLKNVADCALVALQLLETALDKQSRYMALAASTVPAHPNSTTNSIVNMPLAKLLLSVNRRTSIPDHCINIAKYVTYQPYHIYQAAVAVNIIRHVCSSPSTHAQFMSALLTNDQRVSIKYGFVRNLDRDQDEEDETTDSDGREPAASGVEMHLKGGEAGRMTSNSGTISSINNTKKAIIELLKVCLSYNSPNLTHFLLGFDMVKDISKFEFQYAGLMPRACLHSIIDLMQLELSLDTDCISHSLYELFYMLIANTKTAGPVLRFMRLHDMLYVQLLVHFAQPVTKNLSKMAWLLKIFAIELRACFKTMLFISYSKRAIGFLASVPAAKFMSQPQTILSESFAAGNIDAIEWSRDMVEPKESIGAGNFLTYLLDVFSPEVFELSENSNSSGLPCFQFFNNKVLAARIQACQDQITGIVDVEQLHQILYDELKGMQGGAIVGQVQVISQEIPKILNYVISRNRIREQSAHALHFLDGWRQLIETLVLMTPHIALPPVLTEGVALSVLNKLIKYAVKSELLRNEQAVRHLCGCMVVLASKLHKCHYITMKHDNNFRRSTIGMNLDITSDILNSILQWIISSYTSEETLRIHLYAALIHFVSMGNEQHFDGSATNNQLTLYSSTVSLAYYAPLLNEHASKLIDVLCQDSTSGTDATKMLALTTLAYLMEVGGTALTNTWINTHMAGRGYLKQIMKNVTDMDKDMRYFLEPSGSLSTDEQASIVRLLYVYKATMLLFARLASTVLGAQLLIDQKLLITCFGAMSIFEHHPCIDTNTRLMQSNKNKSLSDYEQDYIDGMFKVNLDGYGPVGIYMQAWIPTLQLCDSLLTTLTSDNQVVVEQVLQFILCRSEMFETVFHAASYNNMDHLDVSCLEELSLITCLLCRTANQLRQIVKMCQSDMAASVRTSAFRLNQWMLALLPNLVLTEGKNEKTCMSDYSRFESMPKIDQAETTSIAQMRAILTRNFYKLQIAANVIAYVRVMCSSYGVQHDSIGVLFQPSMTTNKTKSASLATSFRRYPTQSKTHLQTPKQPLGVIVEQITATVDHLRQEKLTMNAYKRKRNDVRDMRSGELNQYLVGDSDPMGQRDVHEDLRRIRTEELFDDFLSLKQQELDTCCFIIENALYVLWLHLDYYMLKTIPKMQTHLHSTATVNNFFAITEHNSSTNDPEHAEHDISLMASASEATWKVSADDISKLKHGLVSIFNDGLSTALSKAFESRPELDKSIVDCLVTKIIRLVQFVPVK